MQYIDTFLRHAVFLIFIFCSVSAFAVPYQLKAENDSFDKNVTTPEKLLANFYANSKVLLLGAANHGNVQHHLILIDLLRNVGTDLNLKFLVLEQFADNDDFYRKLSTADLDSTIKEHAFGSSHEKLITLCWSREWTWVYKNLFPVIQEINQRRPANNQLLVKAVDGFSVKSPFGLSVPFMDVEPMDCKFNDPSSQNTTDNIQNRELATAEGFFNQVWRNLESDQKAIVLYHQTHLYRNFMSCRVLRKGLSAESRISPSNWFFSFLKAHPAAESQSKLVIFDEIDSSHHPQGVLRFTRRQAERRPGVPWAIDVRNMVGIDLERGQNAFLFGPVSFKNEGLNHSDSFFYEIFDGIIYSPRAESDHKVGKISEYMGDICSKEGYDGNSAIPFPEQKP